MAKIDTIIAAASFGLGLLTALSGLFFWYLDFQKRLIASERASAKKALAAERDAAHSRRNQENLIEAVKFLSDEIDRLRDEILKELIELKALAYGQLKRKSDD